MQTVPQAVLRSWSIPPAATFAIALSALVYLRGWWLLRRAGSQNIPPWRAWAFLLGLLSLWVALASPMDVFNSFVLTAHMLQHMMLMMVVPPLILLGAPLVPMVRGLPIFAAREFAGPFLNWSFAKRVGTALTNPVFALVLMGIAMFAWHTPALYELALRSPAWHQTEHACFLFASLIFWWPVVQPWPSRAQWPRWAMVPYLLIADLQNTVLSAILAFSDRVLYPSYSSVPRLFGFSALEDQVAAGAIMWMVGSLAFVVPAIIIAVQCLSKRPSHAASRRRESSAAGAFFSRTTDFPSSRNIMSARWSNERMEAFSFIVLFVAAALCFAGLVSANDDDEQVLRSKETSGPFAVAIFGPPGNLAAGSSRFSVLVQNRESHEVLLDASVDLTAQPFSETQAEPTSARASRADSANKLLQTAELNLPAQGEWTLNIAVRNNSNGSHFSTPLRVVRAEAEVEYPWSYAFMAVFFAILVAVYFRRRRLPHGGERRAHA